MSPLRITRIFGAPRLKNEVVSSDPAADEASVPSNEAMSAAEREVIVRKLAREAGVIDISVVVDALDPQPDQEN